MNSFVRWLVVFGVLLGVLLATASLVIMLTDYGSMGSAPEHYEPPPATERAPIEDPCPAVMRTAALQQLNKRLTKYSALDVWMSGRYTDFYWPDIFITEEGRIEQMRSFANGLSDKCATEAYLYWIEYFEEGITDAKKEFVDQETRKRQEKYQEGIASDRKAVNELVRRGLLPIPPQVKP